LLSQAITGQEPDMDLSAFAPARFGEGPPETDRMEQRQGAAA
jgi:hypothetical protein